MRPAQFGFLAGALPVVIYIVALAFRSKPEERPGMLALLPIFIAGGTFFMVLHLNGSAMTQWARDNTDRESSWLPGALVQEAYPRYYTNAGEHTRLPDPRSLALVEETSVARMFGGNRMDEESVAKVAALPDVEVEDVDLDSEGGLNAKVFAEVTVSEETDSHGHKAITVSVPDGAEAKRRVAFTRDVGGKRIPVYVVDRETYDAVYDGYRERYGHEPELLPPGEFLGVANSELYQFFNPLFVIILTPLLVAFFAFLVARKRGLSTARKIFLGLVMTTLSLLIMALAGYLSDNGGVKVAGLWLVGFYAIVTIGELCLSPMGLSLVTKLSPKRLVGLAMGGWFLATAFGNNFSGFFGGIQSSMTPMNFFLVLAAIAAGVAALILVLLPWMDRTIKQYEGNPRLVG